MAKSKRRGSRVVALRAGSDELVLERPRLVDLSPAQEREALRLLTDLFAQAARRRDRGALREAA